MQNRLSTILVSLLPVHLKTLYTKNDTFAADSVKRDQFGKRDYSDANGPLTVIWNNCRIEDNFMPKNLHQHSVMSESYPNVNTGSE